MGCDDHMGTGQQLKVGEGDSKQTLKLSPQLLLGESWGSNCMAAWLSNLGLIVAKLSLAAKRNLRPPPTLAPARAREDEFVVCRIGTKQLRPN